MRNIGAACSQTAGETDAARMAFFRSRRRSRKPLGPPPPQESWPRLLRWKFTIYAINRDETHCSRHNAV